MRKESRNKERTSLITNCSEFVARKYFRGDRKEQEKGESRDKVGRKGGEEKNNEIERKLQASGALHLQIPQETDVNFVV